MRNLSEGSMPLPIEEWMLDHVTELARLLEYLPDDERDEKLLQKLRDELNRRRNPHANDAG